MRKSFKGLVGVMLASLFICTNTVTAKASELVEMGEFGRPYVVEDSTEQIEEEIRLGEMELIAQLVEAEAGNQDLTGKRMVVDVILNRLDDGRFGDSIEDIIFAPGQFSVVRNGAFEKAAYNMKDSDYEAVRIEYGKLRAERLNSQILYFNNCEEVSGTGTPFKVGGHWFNT